MAASTIGVNKLLRWSKSNNLCTQNIDDITHLSMDGAFGGKLCVPLDMTNRFYEEYYYGLENFERLKRDIVEYRSRYRRDFKSDDNEDKRAEFEFKMANNYVLSDLDETYLKDPPLSITETVNNCEYFRATFDLD